MKRTRVVSGIAMLGVIGLLGCAPSSYETNPQQEAGNAAYSKFITKIEGCTIYELNIQHISHFLYLSKCDSGASVVDTTYSQGKYTASTSLATIPLPKTEEEILESAKLIAKRREVLNKLSDEDKAVLHIE